MTRQQFRLLVIFNQLLVFAGYMIRDLTDAQLPLDLQPYVLGDQSVLDGATGDSFFSGEFPYLLWRVIDVLTLAAAVGLCLGRRWSRTLYLACYITSLFAGLLTPFYVSTHWAGFVFMLYGTTEGMILALAYFSHLRRMFERGEREDEEDLADEAADSA
ncbi:MAG TPA: hypothetical protein VFS10_14070 [Pyrinomonadaceae bacterium]|nr:hypothetical protein [Pyrinomonadaceae bacterium]